jgi:hypothetical protein
MRSPLLTCWLFVKLIWGGILYPMLDFYPHTKFFPTPKRANYKKALADYFFKN